MITTTAVDVSKGHDVKVILLDLYLNSFESRHKVFMDSMRQESKEIQDNFIFLIFAWFKALSEVPYYDDRNRASVELAKKIRAHITGMPPLHSISHEGETEGAVIDYRDDIRMADVMAIFLEAGSKDGYRDFMKEALAAHRTLQQSMTRFFMEWLEAIKDENRWAQEVIGLAKYHPLPMI